MTISDWLNDPRAGYALAGLAGLVIGLVLAGLRFNRFKIDLAVLRKDNERIAELDSQLQDRNIRIEILQQESASLQTRLEVEREAMEEKFSLLQNAEAKLLIQFESLAGKILEEKTQVFSERNKTQLDGLLLPFREQLGEFRKRVDELHVDDARDRASLRQEIHGLRQQTQEINREAVNLTRALKGDKKVQGTWGEMLLERVLEQSGLRKGSEYDVQGGFRDEGNRLLKPDVIVHLPDGKDVVIDSKVSLVAYERYASQEEGPERETSLREHLQAVRSHIKLLGQKDYASLKGLHSLDFILLFMPIEAAFLLAFQQDDRLFDEAFEQRIVIVTPTTLLATLRTIHNIWRYERQNENARLIAERAGAVYDKLRGFLEDMEKLGSQLATVQKTYDEALNKLTRGKGNLVRQAESFVELGVKVGKSLPKSALERAGIDEDESSTL